jgi:beta-glucosidase
MFLIGAATSSHQVEGNNHNDWTEWEKRTAGKSASDARKRNWPEHILNSYPSPLDEKNYVSGLACDHYRRYREDFKLARSLGHTAHRFSIEWSRIEPREGEFDEKEIAHYRDVIAAIRENGMEPFVTLWHWTVPLWFAEKGGWASSGSAKYFSRYAGKVVSALGDGVKFWITLNEPEANTILAYLLGKWPPQKRSPIKYFMVMNNLIGGHNAAYDVIKRIYPDSKVGIAKHNAHFDIAHGGILNRFLEFGANWWWNEFFINRISKHQDFIGLNYYFHVLVKNGFSGFDESDVKNKRISDMNFEIHPEGIYHVLKGLKKYRKPVYITENGIADIHDRHREAFLRETLDWVKKAMGEGVDVRGYLYWSLLDNFEWAFGFWPRFGLVEIDYKNNLERRIRPSAFHYKKMIEEWKDTAGKG